MFEIFFLKKIKKKLNFLKKDECLEKSNQNPKGDLSSVSYTHLRAHETVLDLVCRLLLEKKKNTYYQKNNPNYSSNYYKN